MLGRTDLHDDEKEEPSSPTDAKKGKISPTARSGGETSCHLLKSTKKNTPLPQEKRGCESAGAGGAGAACGDGRLSLESFGTCRALDDPYTFYH